MLKWCCNVLLDLAKKVIPLPWTTGGPNDHSKPQEPTSISSEVSVVDPTYYYKDRVIDMKQLEAIKKRLPPGIDLRSAQKMSSPFVFVFERKVIQIKSKLFQMKSWRDSGLLNKNAMLF